MVAVRGGRMFDITAVAPTMADLLERPDRVELARLAPGEPLGDVRDWLASVWPAARPACWRLATCNR